MVRIIQTTEGCTPLTSSVKLVTTAHNRVKFLALLALSVLANIMSITLCVRREPTIPDKDKVIAFVVLLDTCVQMKECKYLVFALRALSVK